MPVSVFECSLPETPPKYVRVLDRRTDGLVSFEFAIGWPDLSVELLLPDAAFTEFCTTHGVIRLDANTGDTPR
jgi:phenol/toluene 2-monooxygenase (NADH) P0/A0